MKFKTLLIGLIIIAFRVSAQESLIHHEISANVEPSTSYIEVTDAITIPAEKKGNEIKFTLNNVLSLAVQSPGIEIKKLREGIKSDDIGMDREESESTEGVLLNEYQVIFPLEQSYAIGMILLGVTPCAPFLPMIPTDSPLLISKVRTG